MRLSHSGTVLEWDNLNLGHQVKMSQNEIVSFWDCPRLRQSQSGTCPRLRLSQSRTVSQNETFLAGGSYRWGMLGRGRLTFFFVSRSTELFFFVHCRPSKWQFFLLGRQLWPVGPVMAYWLFFPWALFFSWALFFFVSTFFSVQLLGTKFRNFLGVIFQDFWD
jgi:hypothetical protein